MVLRGKVYEIWVALNKIRELGYIELDFNLLCELIQSYIRISSSELQYYLENYEKDLQIKLIRKNDKILVKLKDMD